MRKNHILLVLVLLGSFYSCEKEDNPTTIEEEKVLILEPNSAEWYNRGYPDSLVVQLSGGTSLYSISSQPKFSSVAKIMGNQLVIYPSLINADSTGNDEVVLQDS